MGRTTLRRFPDKDRTSWLPYLSDCKIRRAAEAIFIGFGASKTAADKLDR
jgi:hypothetical protein